MRKNSKHCWAESTFPIVGQVNVVFLYMENKEKADITTSLGHDAFCKTLHMASKQSNPSFFILTYRMEDMVIVPSM